MTPARPVTRWGRLWRGLRIAVFGGSLAVIAFFSWVLAVPFPTELLAPSDVASTRIVDREGRVLYDVPTTAETRGRWVPLSDVSPHLIDATLEAEDRRFYDHSGVDGLAILRSAWINAKAGRVLTGASTITQQLVKLTVQEGEPRTIATKLMEAVWAWRLEAALSKDAILEQYLNRAPYGHQLVGCEAAAWAYFGKSARALSLAEAAFLAALPQAPSRLDPLRHFETARARQQQILTALRDDGRIDAEAWRLAAAEPLAVRPPDSPHEAPHLAALMARGVRAMPQALRVEVAATTLDLPLQRAVQALLATQRPDAALHGNFQAAAIVLDTRTSEVLAWVGSRDWADKDALGANDGVIALRQPGSAMKPFIYARFLENGHATASTFEDAPVTFDTEHGAYRPQNYDRHFHGTVSLRVALASSLNIPAIEALRAVGVSAMLECLHALGLATLDQSAEDYGLGLALGDGNIRLVDLANAYAALGRLGEWRPVRWTRNGAGARAPTPPEAPRQVFSRPTALEILDILADDRARGIGFGHGGPLALPYRLAAKTGTSSDYRDNWAFGVTPDYTVGVWVGNFDGHPMNRVSGPIGASPLLRQIFQILYPRAATRTDVAWFPPPPSAGVRVGAQTD